MNIKKWIRTVVKGFYSMTEGAAWIGYISISFIVLLVFVDVCGRYFFNKPLLGAFELVGVTMGIAGGAAIMYATVKRGHIALDLLITRFSRRTQIIMQGIFSLLGFGTLIVAAYQIYLNALDTLQTTGVLHVSLTPFLLLLAVAVFLSSLTLLIQVFHHGVSEGTQAKKEEAVNEL
jgi:TRAP-type C4-dicarboxylate transport system permease small subunit